MMIIRRTMVVLGIATIALTACAADSTNRATSTTPRTSTSAAPTTTTTPGREPPPGTIVFDATWTTGEHLHAVETGKVRNRDNVLGSGVVGHAPQISPDGTQLAYTRSPAPGSDAADIYLMDLRTGQERRVGPGGCPTWTADAQALIVRGTASLLRMEFDGTTAAIPGTADGCGLDIGHDRYLVWDQVDHLDLVDHGKRSVLFRAPSCGIGPAGADSRHRRIAVTVTCGESGGPVHEGLWVVDPSTRSAERILEGSAYGAAWSPDDNWIATVRTSHREDGSTTTELWAVSTDGRQAGVIWKGGVNNPTWGPSL